MVILIAACVIAFLSWICGYAFGEHRGIRDTERRWSDAVGRSADR
jgi:hypothetical protein